MFIGADLIKNAFIYGVEEWTNIPGRLADYHEQLYTICLMGWKYQYLEEDV